MNLIDEKLKPIKSCPKKCPKKKRQIFQTKLNFINLISKELMKKILKSFLLRVKKKVDYIFRRTIHICKQTHAINIIWIYVMKFDS